MPIRIYERGYAVLTKEHKSTDIVVGTTYAYDKIMRKSKCKGTVHIHKWVRVYYCDEWGRKDYLRLPVKTFEESFQQV